MFDESKFYLTGNPALLALGKPLADWRSEEKGPAYIKLSPGKGRVAYSGKALNEWIESLTVRPGTP